MQKCGARHSAPENEESLLESHKNEILAENLFKCMIYCHKELIDQVLRLKFWDCNFFENQINFLVSMVNIKLHCCFLCSSIISY